MGPKAFQPSCLNRTTGFTSKNIKLRATAYKKLIDILSDSGGAKDVYFHQQYYHNNHVLLLQVFSL